MIANGGDRDDLHAVFVKLRRVEADVVDDDDDLGIAGLARIEAESAGPARHNRADVTVALVVGFDGAGDGLGHLLPAHGDFKLDPAGAVVEPIDVLAKPKDLAFVHADSFEDTVAVE